MLKIFIVKHIINITLVIIKVVYSSYSNYSIIIIILSKGNNDKNKNDNSNTVGKSDNVKESQNDRSMNFLKFSALKAISIFNTST